MVCDIEISLDGKYQAEQEGVGAVSFFFPLKLNIPSYCYPKAFRAVPSVFRPANTSLHRI